MTQHVEVCSSMNFMKRGSYTIPTISMTRLEKMQEVARQSLEAVACLTSGQTLECMFSCGEYMYEVCSRNDSNFVEIDEAAAESLLNDNGFKLYSVMPEGYQKPKGY